MSTLISLGPGIEICCQEESSSLIEEKLIRNQTLVASEEVGRVRKIDLNCIKVHDKSIINPQLIPFTASKNIFHEPSYSEMKISGIYSNT